MDNESFVPDTDAMGNYLTAAGHDDLEDPEQLDPLTSSTTDTARDKPDKPEHDGDGDRDRESLTEGRTKGEEEEEEEAEDGGGDDKVVDDVDDRRGDREVDKENSKNKERNSLLQAHPGNDDDDEIITVEDETHTKDIGEDGVKDANENVKAEADSGADRANTHNTLEGASTEDKDKATPNDKAEGATGSDKQNGANSGSGAANNNKKKEDAIEVLVAGKDDVDAASTYSLYMEKDFRYYFQHPYSRMFVSYFVVFCNFLIYAEDPVAHSRKECLIPMIGNDIAMVMTRYPPNAWSLLKVVFWLIGILIGMLVGKILIHGLLLNKLFRLKMFTDDQGSWMIMFLVSLICVFIMSCFYNLFLMIGGESTEPYRISDLMGISNDIFMKVAACGTWCGDFFTAWMVTDIMLQEKLYPGWARPVRTWWKAGYHRIVLFWIVVAITSFIVVFVIATDYINWDKLNHDFLPTNELSRAILASFILVMDLLIVMQDWDFPHFFSAIDIKLPGLNTAHIRFEIPKCLRKEVWKVHITGKWFNYGVLFLVMLLDLNMWKNQIFYSPYDYGQYVSHEDRIYSVQDHYSLENHNESQITYDFRSTNIDNSTGKTYLEGDTHMNTKYMNFHVGLKALAFFPCIIMFIVFGVLLWRFGRFKPTQDNPYAGRLKKRIKKRLSFRLPWRRRAEIKRKVHAVPKLLYFKKKKGSAKDGEVEAKEIPSEGFSIEQDDKTTEIPSVTAVTETA